MSENLHIIEISPHVYAGSINTRASLDAPIIKTNSSYITPSIPTGGIAFIFNKIFDFSGRGDIIFVADRNPTIKKEIFPDYKIRRRTKRTAKQIEEDININNQRDLAEEILEDCGFKVYSGEGYEADDFIYAICKKYGKDFNHIFIHADDSDNFINITDNVSALPAQSRGKVVTKENYSVTVSSKEITPYAALNFSHFLFGKASNDVPPLPKEMRDKLIRLVWNETHFKYMREKDLMREVVKNICPKALEQFDVIYPLDVEVELSDYKSIDKLKVEAWGAAVDCNRYNNRRRIKPIIQHKVDKFFSEGRALNM